MHSHTIKYILIVLSLSTLSCNWAKQKTKETVNKTGEVVAKTGSEFVDGMAKGVQRTFRNEVILSKGLSEKGLETGKLTVNSTDSSSSNVLTAYLIFNKDFQENVTLKVIDEEGHEYGRLTYQVAGKKGEAKYFDFVFDKRTNIDWKGKILVD